VAGLAIGKSLGVFLAAAAAVRTGIAVMPAEYRCWQWAGAGALAGIGFTMSLLIAGQAFPGATDFSAAKMAVFVASILWAVVGTAMLWGASRQELIEEAPQSAGMQVS
jgi:NhaA family Na+:H+ antiporter